MTDHGNMFGAIDFYNARELKELNQLLEWKPTFIIKKILGIKQIDKDFTYVYMQKTKLDIKINVFKLTSLYAWFYYYPRINKQLLKR